MIDFLEVCAALRKLLASDGHPNTCSFIRSIETRGCSCGSVEEYKVARAEAVALLRKLNPKFEGEENES